MIEDADEAREGAGSATLGAPHPANLGVWNGVELAAFDRRESEPRDRVGIASERASRPENDDLRAKRAPSLGAALVAVTASTR